MVKVVISILITFSVLSASIGVNTVYTDCPVCISHNEPASQTACCMHEPVALQTQESCCSPANGEETIENDTFCSMGGECCVFELVKLDSPFILLASYNKISIPDFDIFPGLLYHYKVSVSSQLEVSGNEIVKPPGFRDSLNKFHCNYIC